MLLDFSKSYGTVSQEKLLLCMVVADIPMNFIRWYGSFLTSHRGHVQLHNSFSSSRRFNQGFLQGFVLNWIEYFIYRQLKNTIAHNKLIGVSNSHQPKKKKKKDIRNRGTMADILGPRNLTDWMPQFVVFMFSLLNLLVPERRLQYGS